MKRTLLGIIFTLAGFFSFCFSTNAAPIFPILGSSVNKTSSFGHTWTGSPTSVVYASEGFTPSVNMNLSDVYAEFQRTSSATTTYPLYGIRMAIFESASTTAQLNLANGPCHHGDSFRDCTESVFNSTSTTWPIIKDGAGNRITSYSTPFNYVSSTLGFVSNVDLSSSMGMADFHFTSHFWTVAEPYQYVTPVLYAGHSYILVFWNTEFDGPYDVFNTDRVTYNIGGQTSISGNGASFSFTSWGSGPWGTDDAGIGKVDLVGTISADSVSTTYDLIGSPSSSLLQVPNVVCPNWGDFTFLCTWTVWVLVPDPSLISTQASSTYANMVTRFPFSYIASVQTAITAAQNTTSSQSINIQMNFGNTLSSSTSFGAWAPNITMFSTTTIEQYIPSGTWTFLKILLEISVYSSTVYLIYWGVLKLFNPHEENHV